MSTSKLAEALALAEELVEDLETRRVDAPSCARKPPDLLDYAMTWRQRRGFGTKSMDFRRANLMARESLRPRDLVAVQHQATTDLPDFGLRVSPE
jgi:hypothetical protein